jgi:hypothetical protein
MSKYYNPRKTKNLYNPLSKEPFKISRSKLELFLKCPRCFYLDVRLGTGQPGGFPFSLNSAVDKLLKKEFDIHRAENKTHPLIEKYGVDAVPVADNKLEQWRNNFHGIQFLHEKTNFLIFGAIDDLWKNSQGEYIIVDYKATSKNKEIKELDEDWQDSYKRQMEIYQWLLRHNGYPVSNTGYFVYCNGITDKKAFDAKLEFDISLVKYVGNDDWVEPTILKAYQCLQSDKIPQADPDCDFCAYREAVKDLENTHETKS